MTDLSAQILFNSDRRAAPRHEVNQTAQALIPEATEAVSCVIVDISSTGARIAVEDEACFLPKTLKLYIEQMHVIADCQQMWRKGREVGLAFTSTTSLTPTQD